MWRSDTDVFYSRNKKYSKSSTCNCNHLICELYQTLSLKIWPKCLFSPLNRFPPQSYHLERIPDHLKLQSHYYKGAKCLLWLLFFPFAKVKAAQTLILYLSWFADQSVGSASHTHRMTPICLKRAAAKPLLCCSLLMKWTWRSRGCICFLKGND